MSDWDKRHMKHRGLPNTHFCKNKLEISRLRKKKIVNFHFSHHKSMENISCHSNQSSYPTGIKNKKNTIHVESNVLSMHVCQVSASSPLWFLRRRFFNIFQKFTIQVTPATNQIKRFGQKTYETWRTTQ